MRFQIFYWAKRSPLTWLTRRMAKSLSLRIAKSRKRSCASWRWLTITSRSIRVRFVTKSARSLAPTRTNSQNWISNANALWTGLRAATTSIRASSNKSKFISRASANSALAIRWPVATGTKAWLPVSFPKKTCRFLRMERRLTLS